MEFLPIFLKCHNRLAVVIGGSSVALRKIRLLNRAGMRIKVVARRCSDALYLLSKHRTITLQERDYQETDIDNAFFVIAATDDSRLNLEIGEHCRKRSILFNNVDGVDDSDFIFPTTIHRPPMQIAVTTGGASPLLARSLAKHLANCTPNNYSKLAALVGDYRDRVKQTFAASAERKLFWETVLRSRVADLVFENRVAAAEALLQKMLERKIARPEAVGEVYLVGAGPGDPDLLTFKALRLMQQADVVLYDRLVSPPILELLRSDAEKIYVGKERGKHTIPQEDINRLLVKYARKGFRVLRLKGGDPLIFGRGGEEINRLAQENITFQIVPGITAASGCAAYAGIPLTHRDYAHSCIFAAGHLRDGSIDLNWSALIADKQTIVFYMGLQGLDQICAQLVAHGLAADTPAALIAKGTTQQQQVVVSAVAELAAQVGMRRVVPPTLLIIGDVVKCRQRLSWFTPHKECRASVRHD